MLAYYHRDLLAKVIKMDDYVVWSNGKYNQSMQICRVVGVTANKVVILRQDNSQTRVYPKNLVVITEQVMFNLQNNVGANL